MIEINLIPEEFKIKVKKSSAPDIKRMLYLIPLGIIILLLAHISLGVSNVSLNSKYRVLNAKWKELEPQRKKWEVSNKENLLLIEEDNISQQLLSERISWADKLNKLSLRLPSGIWFNEIVLLNKEFTLKAVVFSLAKEEMGLINKFLTSLKDDAGFACIFKSLELGSIKREMINNYDIISFSITGAVK